MRNASPTGRRRRRRGGYLSTAGNVVSHAMRPRNTARRATLGVRRARVAATLCRLGSLIPTRARARLDEHDAMIAVRSTRCFRRICIVFCRLDCEEYASQFSNIY